MPFVFGIDNESLLKRVRVLELNTIQNMATLENLSAALKVLESKINTTNSEVTGNFESQEQNRNEVNKLKLKLNELKEVTDVLKVEESCLHFAKMGFSESGEYPIDPDGKSQNLPPIMAHCSLPDGKTTVGKPNLK